MKNQCSCGNPIPEETLGLAKMFPNLCHDPKCDDCTEAQEARDRAHNAELEAQQETARRRARLDAIPPEMRRTRENHPGFNPELWQSVSYWDYGNYRWLGIVGGAGQSKTRCLALLAMRLILDGHLLTWTTAVDFQDRVDDLRLGTPEQIKEAHRYFNQCKNAGILVFDDLGKNTWNNTFEKNLFSLIDYRKTHDLPVLWSANTHPMKILMKGIKDTSRDAERLSEDRGAPLIGRIIEASRIIGVDGQIINHLAA